MGSHERDARWERPEGVTHSTSFKPGWRPIAAALLLALAVAVTGAAADEAQTGPHVRTESAGLREMIEDGGRRSSTFHSLVAHLDRSNVLVYIEHQRLPLSLRGRLRLAGASDGWRYVRIQLDCRATLSEQLATLGHELRHAVEIADADVAVDPASVQQLYGRIGYSTDSDHLKFETQAAIDAGRRVFKEVLSQAATVAAR